MIFLTKKLVYISIVILWMVFVNPTSAERLVIISISETAPSGIVPSNSSLELDGDLMITRPLPFLSAVEFPSSLPPNDAMIIVNQYGAGLDARLVLEPETGNPYGTNRPQNHRTFV